jgi:hypothetical protein
VRTITAIDFVSLPCGETKRRPAAVVKVLALVDWASAIVYRGIIGECPAERDAGFWLVWG